MVIGEGLVNNTSSVNQNHSPSLEAPAPSPEIKQETTTTPQTDQQSLPTTVTETLVVVGSGLAGYSAAIAACAYSRPPLLITGPSLGGRLTDAEPLDYWPGAAPDAKGSALATSLHAQAARLGVRFINDTVKSINTEAKPYVISTECNGFVVASAVIVATGLSPKLLGLNDESLLIGRSVFTSSAVMGGPHKDVAVVGNGSLAIAEALELSTMVAQVTVVCDAPSFTCSPALFAKLADVTNVKVACGASVLSYITDESEGGPLLWQLSCKGPSEAVFTVDATAVVLAVGYEPKVDLLPSEVKTADGYVKANADALEGIFCAGSIVEATSDQAIMIAASGYEAARRAECYLAAEERKQAAAKEELERSNKLNAVQAPSGRKEAEPEVAADERQTTIKATEADGAPKPAEAVQSTSAEESAKPESSNLNTEGSDVVTSPAPAGFTSPSADRSKGPRTSTSKHSTLRGPEVKRNVPPTGVIALGSAE
ncbi:MAG: NAD(P)/FAD-dependent oxidoreductase [Candidatus Hodgkinia cicadicola]